MLCLSCESNSCIVPLFWSLAAREAKACISLITVTYVLRIWTIILSSCNQSSYHTLISFKGAGLFFISCHNFIPILPFRFPSTDYASDPDACPEDTYSGDAQEEREQPLQCSLNTCRVRPAHTCVSGMQRRRPERYLAQGLRARILAEDLGSTLQHTNGSSQSFTTPVWWDLTPSSDLQGNLIFIWHTSIDEQNTHAMQ